MTILTPIYNEKISVTGYYQVKLKPVERLADILALFLFLI